MENDGTADSDLLINLIRRKQEQTVQVVLFSRGAAQQ